MNTQSWSEEGRSSCLFPKRTHTCDKLVLRFADAFCTILKTFTGMFLPKKIFWRKWELFFSCGEFLPPPNEARKRKNNRPIFGPPSSRSRRSIAPNEGFTEQLIELNDNGDKFFGIIYPNLVNLSLPSSPRLKGRRGSERGKGRFRQEGVKENECPVPPEK